MNAIKHSEESPQIRIARRVHCDRFICEIEDDGPKISENLSSTYLELWRLGGTHGDRVTHRGACPNCLSDLLVILRSAKLGGTQVKIELPLVGY